MNSTEEAHENVNFKVPPCKESAQFKRRDEKKKVQSQELV